MAAALLLCVVSACCRSPQPLPRPVPEKQQELIVLIPPGPLTYEAAAGEEAASGLDHDLIQMFAGELGVPVRFTVVAPHEIRARLARHEGHMAAGWLTPIDDPRFKYSRPYLTTRDTLVRHEAALPIRTLESLAGRTVHAGAGSRQVQTLLALQARIPGLEVEAFPSENALDLLEAVADRKVEIALVDEAVLDMGLNFYPTLQAGLGLGEPHPITWMFPADGDPAIHALAQDFLLKIGGQPTMAQIYDRYLGHVERLKPIDITTFIERTKTLLPRYRPYFRKAQIKTDLDWRLLAALSYQESHWNPLGTSPTGVRGIMMLTGDTADFLGVRNRLDPEESILAGARYLLYLKNSLPESTLEPDRTWQALAAYNIGPGHFNAARMIARQEEADADSWFDMKRILPLLARPQYYRRLKSGKARGGEAVIMVENIRVFYDVIQRHEPPYNPMDEHQESDDLHLKPPETQEPRLKVSPALADGDALAQP
jgi:membrane-bound lytic murein transglycosylase F